MIFITQYSEVNILFEDDIYFLTYLKPVIQLLDVLERWLVNINSNYRNKCEK